MASNDDFVREQVATAGAKNFSSQEVEASVIAAFLSGVDEAKNRLTEISEADFFYPDNGKIFKAIQATHAKQLEIDIITVDATLGELYAQEQSRLSSIMVSSVNSRFLSRNIDCYIRIVKELSARRECIRLMEDMAGRLKDPENDMTEILDTLRTEAMNISVSKHKWASTTDVMLATFEYLDERSKGAEQAITTGIPNVDNLIGGFFGGELTVIGARPSIGKSAFGANIAIEAAKRGFKPGIASREMIDVQFGQRMLAYDTGIDGMKLRKAELDCDDWIKIGESLTALSTLPISFLFTVRTVEDLRTEVQRKVEKGELDMLIVDYLQLMRTTKRFKEEHLRVGYISWALKDIATSMNIPVVALAQVNRDTDGQMPTLKSLKASGDIEQDADGVIFLHRPSSSDDEYVDPRDRAYFNSYEQHGLTYICIGVAKQRQGSTGKACVLFDAAHMRYYPIDRDAEQVGG